MRVIRIAGCALALGALLVACAEQAPVTSVEDGPLFNWMNNPDNGNIRIERYLGHVAFSWTDDNSTLRATHTTYPFSPNCGELQLFEPMSWQDVVDLDPDDELRSRIRDVGQGAELNIMVRDLSQPGDCFGALLLAKGTGHVRYTDNDIFGWYPPDQTNANAFGYMAQGKVTSPDGEEMHYNGFWRCTFKPGWDEDQPANCSAKVNLK